RSQTFTYLATDECGNTASATTTYTWTEEQIAPLLAGVPADEDLGCNPELPTCNANVTASDGCSEATVVCTPGEIMKDGCERSQTFTYTATDDCGNTVSATTTYTWTEDLTPPVWANVPADEDLGYNPELPTCDAEVTAFDECSEVTLTCTPGDIVQNEDIRTQTFTYMATDECGNSASATTTYTWTEGMNAPVADFAAEFSTLTTGETALFEDLSANSPESWSWKFEGGTPATSTLKNPHVSYDKPGNYGVTLTVANAGGSDTKTVENFITVEENLPEYCWSNGNASEEWIASVTIGNQFHESNSTGTTGYQNFSETVLFQTDAGTSVNFSLTPGFLNRWQYQYWRIWIDFNGDADFDDSGELVYTSSRARGTVSGSFTIPADVSGSSRMRISMKRDAVPTACEIFSKGEVKDYTLHIEAPLPQPPVAGFSAGNTQVEPGNTVQFTDLSSNEPTSWYWEFPGGIPDRSSDPNPLITYDSSGEFDVTLVVSKDGFEPSEMVKLKYITVTVTENTTEDYCTPVAVNSSTDYIQNITIGDVLNSSTAGSGYSLSANTVIMAPGQNYSVSLSPNDSGNRNFWRIWIDLNGDGYFDEADETLLAINNKKGTVTSNITIPAYAT
ncbi:MAG: GEVED domain-containing protein, partial [Bacteroidales bacterium]|nr:GEVED domain-containing protein [Bacteroidales bacterium]